MSDKPKTINSQVWEPIVIVGRDNKANNEELKELLKAVGITLIEPESDLTRGLSVATVSKGSKASIEKAVRLTPIMNRRERKAIIQELKQKI